MIGAETAVKHANQYLSSAVAAYGGLSESALKVLAGLSAWPECVLRHVPNIVSRAECCRDSTADLADILAADQGGIIQSILVAVFGDLQAVWSDSKLKYMLLELPCPALQLLLSSDQLQVPSEDIVLYTAQEYVNNRPNPGIVAIKSALATLIRAPHLSDVLLHHAALAADSSKLVMTKLLTPLRQLLLLRHTLGHRRDEAFYKELGRFAELPDSWKLQQRRVVPAAPATVVWKTQRHELTRGCRRAFRAKKSVSLQGPESPPVCGFAWHWTIKRKGSEDGVKLNLAVGASRASANFYLAFKPVLYINGPQMQVKVDCLRGGVVYTWHDPFSLGVMASGWDEAAWAAQGLPTEEDWS